MKIMKKVLAVFLTVALFVGLVAPSVSAATATNHASYKKYVCLGDSIATGWGPNNMTNRGFSRVDFAYPALLADTIDTKMVTLARNGFRTTELRYMIEADYEGDEYNFKFGKISKSVIKKYRSIFPKQIESADLITLGIGSNDCLNLAKVRVFDYIDEYATDSAATNQLNAIMAEDDGDQGSTLVRLLSLASNMGIYAGAAMIAVDAFYDGYQSFTENFDVIINDIYALNPDVELIVVGMYNPFKNLKVLEASPIGIGHVLDIISMLENTYMSAECKYASKYTYVDISQVEIYDLPAITSDEFTTEDPNQTISPYIHPTLEGHQYIAERILRALPYENTGILDEIG